MGNLNDGKWNPQADLVIELNLDMVGAIFLKLYAPKKMDIGCMGIEIGQSEGYLGLSDGLVFLGIIDETFLGEVAASPAPAGPEAEFEKTDRQGWGWNCAEYPHKRLLTADFSSHILAEDGRLQVGKNNVFTHEMRMIVSQVFPERKGSVKKIP